MRDYEIIKPEKQRLYEENKALKHMLILHTGMGALMSNMQKGKLWNL